MHSTHVLCGSQQSYVTPLEEEDAGFDGQSSTAAFAYQSSVRSMESLLQPSEKVSLSVSLMESSGDSWRRGLHRPLQDDSDLNAMVLLGMEDSNNSNTKKSMTRVPSYDEQRRKSVQMPRSHTLRKHRTMSSVHTMQTNPSSGLLPSVSSTKQTLSRDFSSKSVRSLQSQTQSEVSGLVKQKFKNSFHISELQPRLLGYALHTFLPSVLYMNVPSISEEKFLLLFKIMTHPVALNPVLAEVKSDFVTEETLLDILNPLKGEIHSALENDRGRHLRHFTMDSAAAGKPGNEDRVAVVPNLLPYYGMGSSVTHYFACVCDGHGGSDTASSVRDNFPAILAKKAVHLDMVQALRHAVTDMQQKLETDYETTCSQSGSTLTAVVITGQVLTVANLGDSHAIIVKKDGRARRITVHHHVESMQERDSIIESGGEVYEVSGVLRVGGRCRVTRNLGLIGCPVLHVPDITTHVLEPDDDSVVLATDGVWDVMCDADVAKLVLPRDFGVDSADVSDRRQASITSSILGSTAESVMSLTSSSYSGILSPVRISSSAQTRRITAAQLINEAVVEGTKDNVGVVVICLNHED